MADLMTANPIPPTTDRRDQPALTVTRSYSASLEQVYGAFARQETFEQWFGPKGCRVEDCDWQPREGRAWKLSLRHADDDVATVAGVFREVLPGERLVLTWAWTNTEYAGLETLVTFAFRALGDQTEVSITHEWLPDDTARERHNKGWSSSLESLADLLA